MLEPVDVQLTDLKFEREAVNFEVLDAELRAAVGEGYAGLTRAGSDLRVHLSDESKADSLAELVAQVVMTHKPEVLSETQQADQDRRDAIQQLRAKPWQSWTEADKDRLLWVLATQLGAVDDSAG